MCQKSLGGRNKFTDLFRIIAIMLGRLCMSVDECIRAYKKMAEKAFIPKRGINLSA